MLLSGIAQQKRRLNFFDVFIKDYKHFVHQIRLYIDKTKKYSFRNYQQCYVYI